MANHHFPPPLWASYFSLFPRIEQANPSEGLTWFTWKSAHGKGYSCWFHHHFHVPAVKLWGCTRAEETSSTEKGQGIFSQTSRTKQAVVRFMKESHLAEKKQCQNPGSNEFSWLNNNWDEWWPQFENPVTDGFHPQKNMVYLKEFVRVVNSKKNKHIWCRSITIRCHLDRVAPLHFREDIMHICQGGVSG